MNSRKEATLAVIKTLEISNVCTAQPTVRKGPKLCVKHVQLW